MFGAIAINEVYCQFLQNISVIYFLGRSGVARMSEMVRDSIGNAAVKTGPPASITDVTGLVGIVVAPHGTVVVPIGIVVDLIGIVVAPAVTVGTCAGTVPAPAQDVSRPIRAVLKLANIPAVVRKWLNPC